MERAHLTDGGTEVPGGKQHGQGHRLQLASGTLGAAALAEVEGDRWIWVAESPKEAAVEFKEKPGEARRPPPLQ